MSNQQAVTRLARTFPLRFTAELVRNDDDIHWLYRQFDMVKSSADALLLNIAPDIHAPVRLIVRLSSLSCCLKLSTWPHYTLKQTKIPPRLSELTASYGVIGAMIADLALQSLYCQMKSALFTFSSLRTNAETTRSPTPQCIYEAWKSMIRLMEELEAEPGGSRIGILEGSQCSPLA